MLNPTIDPFDYVVFGGTGDLSLRKLLPALYYRERDGQLPTPGRIIAVSRSVTSDADFVALVGEHMKRHLKPADFDETVWTRFAARLGAVSVDAASDHGWADLAALLREGEDRVRVFYLATSPDLFGLICRRLGDAGLVTARSRVVLEKPIGHDLASAKQINAEVSAVFEESQVFRIDHYLGKETVQNLLALRFANALFEPLWNSNWIDHVQITVAETLGVEGRGGYYDRSGAFRDMVQNHLLQLICLIAMEPPLSLDKETVRDEKLKVLRALAPIRPDEVGTLTVRGQYRAGVVGGESVRGYTAEDKVAPDSTTETFVAVKAAIRNWRWAGVPFYIRSGKRLPDRLSEVVIQFRPVPYFIFPADSGEIVANKLIIRVQPDEGIRLRLMTKEPGPGGIRLKSAPLNLSFAETFKKRFPDAYERLLMDVLRGNPTLFMRRDEVEAAWTWTEAVLDAWDQRGEAPKPYSAGTWGPSAAIALIERDGRTWHDDQAGEG